MNGLTAILVATLASSAAQSSRAGEMQPLFDVVAEAATPYGLTRCAALYLSVMEWAGSERMGEENWSAAVQAYETFALSAAVVAHNESGGDLEAHGANIVRQVRTIANLYLERFETNYAVSGQAFAEDLIVASDLTFCQSLAERITR